MDNQVQKNQEKILVDRKQLLKFLDLNNSIDSLEEVQQQSKKTEYSPKSNVIKQNIFTIKRTTREFSPNTPKVIPNQNKSPDRVQMKQSTQILTPKIITAPIKKFNYPQSPMSNLTPRDSSDNNSEGFSGNESQFYQKSVQNKTTKSKFITSVKKDNFLQYVQDYEGSQKKIMIDGLDIQESVILDPQKNDINKLQMKDFKEVENHKNTLNKYLGENQDANLQDVAISRSKSPGRPQKIYIKKIPTKKQQIQETETLQQQISAQNQFTKLNKYYKNQFLKEQNDIKAPQIDQLNSLIQFLDQILQLFQINLETTPDQLLNYQAIKQNILEKVNSYTKINREEISDIYETEVINKAQLSYQLNYSYKELYESSRDFMQNSIQNDNLIKKLKHSEETQRNSYNALLSVNMKILKENDNLKEMFIQDIEKIFEFSSMFDQQIPMNIENMFKTMLDRLSFQKTTIDKLNQLNQSNPNPKVEKQKTIKK